jgi:hypothetical protein
MDGHSSRQILLFMEHKKTSKLTVSPNSINPVDFYNQNYLEHTIELLLRKPTIEQTGDTSLTFIKNRSDKNKRMIVIDKENKTFTAEMENGLEMAIGEPHTPFMMLQKFVYKGKWTDTLSHVMYDLMCNNNDYCRVGFKYFQRITKTDRWGIERTTLEYWERTALIDDYGKDFLGNVEKFKCFVMKPDNIKYQLKVNGGYNLYKQFAHTPMPLEDFKGDKDWKWTRTLLKHIFGEHYEMGLVYMKVLYEYPEQMLPILVLLSKERQTGKTTFVNWCTMLFGGNSVIINPEDIKSGFNAPYAHKNLIMIEESHFDNRQSLEKIKNLATQKTMNVNPKFIPQYDIEFFGKIIITSNDESKFSKVDNEEIRYWVRKVPVLKGEANHNIEDSLRQEVPAFLRFLLEMGRSTKKYPYLDENGKLDTTGSRMIFKQEHLQTEALADVKMESRESLHKDIELYLDMHSMQNPTIKDFMFVAINIKDKWFQHNSRFGTSYVNRVLKTNMELERIEKTTRFIPLEEEAGLQNKLVGKPFVYPNKYYDPEGNNDIEPEVEF